MFKGKTKQGVSITSTLGMQVSKARNIWILVADRSRVQMFKYNKSQTGKAIELEQELSNSDGRKKPSELLADRPGRVFASHSKAKHGQTGGLRHSYAESDPYIDSTARKILQIAVGLCSSEQLKKIGTELFLMTGPRLMGVLRPALQKLIPKAQIKCSDKNFAWIKTNELKNRLDKLVS